MAGLLKGVAEPGLFLTGISIQAGAHASFGIDIRVATSLRAWSLYHGVCLYGRKHGALVLVPFESTRLFLEINSRLRDY